MYTSTCTVNFLYKGQPRLLQTLAETETLWKHTTVRAEDRKKFGKLWWVLWHIKNWSIMYGLLCRKFTVHSSICRELMTTHMWYSISLCYTTFTLNESEYEHKIGMNYVLFFQSAQSTPFLNVNYEAGKGRRKYTSSFVLEWKRIISLIFVAAQSKH